METTPLNRVIDTFRALRLRYVLVVRNGALVGITTKVRVREITQERASVCVRVREALG